MHKAEPKGIRMSRYKICTLVVVVLALGISCVVAFPSTHAGMPVKRIPVLVELFTSEGCSDCPPADQVLAQLAGNNLVDGIEVIAMSEHVDYWNRLGWSDPFSAAQFSMRQNEYAQAFGNRDIYTPQMVVDGQLEFVGSNRVKAIQAVAHAAQIPKASIIITQIGRDKEMVKLQVSVDSIAGLPQSEPADVFLAVTENNLFSNVARGENQGRRLMHAAVVRKLTLIGKISEGHSFNAAPVVQVDRQWKVKDLSVVAFVQARRDRRILAVSSAPTDWN
jgi:hypothetical protein